MSWLVQKYDGVWHCVPGLDVETHVLAYDCWCEPQLDDFEHTLLLHRDSLDRSGVIDPEEGGVQGVRGNTRGQSRSGREKNFEKRDAT
jgi:hypothetical protein